MTPACPAALERDQLLRITSLALSFGFGVTHSTKLVVIFSRWHPSGESSACGCKGPGQVLGGGPLLPNQGMEETRAALGTAVAAFAREVSKVAFSILSSVQNRARQACD